VKHQLIAGLCFAVIVALFAGDNGYNVRYDGGSLSDTKAGTGLKMYIDAKQVRFVRDNAELARIPASAITEINYGQDDHRRRSTAIAAGVFASRTEGLTAPSQSNELFVGLAWADGDQTGNLAVQCDNNDYRSLLAGLEGISGKKAVNSESMNVEN
jgi:hypothetical protein